MTGAKHTLAEVYSCKNYAAACAARRRAGHALLMTAVAAIACLLTVAPAGAAGLGGPLPVNTTPGATDSDHVIVRFASTAGRAERSGLRRLAGIEAGGHVPGVPGLEVATVQDGQSVGLALAALNASDEVLYAEPDKLRRVSLIPNDEFFDVLWGLNNIGQDPDGTYPEGSAGLAGADVNAVEAWDDYAGGSAPVAVADTGVDDDHQDLDDALWSNTGESGGTPGVDDDLNGYTDDLHGWDWTTNGGPSCTTSGDNNPDPPNWDGTNDDSGYHGSHVGSTIGAERGNGVGIAGVNPGAGLMALRIGGTDGYINESAELCAIAYAGANGARVYNGSYGGYGASPGVTDLIAANPHVLFVFAAGNDAVNVDGYPVYPCATPAANVICVGASTNHEQMAWFSNYGAMNVDLLAPGELIGGAFNTATGDEYYYLDGTSMATPHVSGAASLIMARYPALSVAEVKQALLSGVDQRSTYTCMAGTGGRLNLERALDVAASIAAGAPSIPQLAPCNLPGYSPPGADDGKPPIVALLGTNKAKLKKKAKFSFGVWCNKNCSFTYTVKVSKVGAFNGVGSTTGGTMQKVVVVPSAKMRRKLLKATKRRSRPAFVTVTGTDAQGRQGAPARFTLGLRR